MFEVMMRATWIPCVLVLSTGPTLPASASNDASGTWLTDQRDGTVEIRPCGSNLCGYIHSIDRVPDPGKPLLDNRNVKPELRTRRLCGLQILGGLQKQSADTWGNGWVYDPKDGKTHNVEITLQGNDSLTVRGYLGVRLLGRTVTWTRVRAVAKCK